MKNMLKEKMLSGAPTLGTFFETGSTTVAQCLGLAGLDYIIIDNEHGPFDPQSTLEYVRAAKLFRKPHLPINKYSPNIIARNRFALAVIAEIY